MPRLPPLIACHTVCFGPFGGRGAMDHLASLGLTALEVPVRTAGFRSRFDEAPLLTDAVTEGELDQLSGELTDRGLTIAACPCLAGNLLREEEVERVRQKFRIAARMGAPIVTLDVGEASTDEEYARLCALLRDLGDQAQSLQLTACIEIARGVARNHRFLLQLVRDVDHRHIRASFDPGMLHFLNDEIHSEVALAKICHLVKHVRLRDSRGAAGVRDFPVLGTGGRVSFLRIYQIMRDCGYRGPFSIAIEGPPTEPPRSLELYLEQISQSLAYLRRIGSLDPY